MNDPVAVQEGNTLKELPQTHGWAGGGVSTRMRGGAQEVSTAVTCADKRYRCCCAYLADERLDCTRRERVRMVGVDLRQIVLHALHHQKEPGEFEWRGWRSKYINACALQHTHRHTHTHTRTHTRRAHTHSTHTARTRHARTRHTRHTPGLTRGRCEPRRRRHRSRPRWGG